MLIPFSDITKKYDMKIHGILHIGANNCEELATYSDYGLKNNQIIWIEANPKIVENNLRVDKSRIIKNLICSDTDRGKTKLNLASNGQSSSILDLETLETSYPFIKYNDVIQVNNCRIDTMYNQYKIPNNFANFLNIDIQGAELLTLKGTGDIINYFDYVYLEVNKDYVYKNCPLVDEIDEYLSKYNLVRVETYWTKHNWGHALYIRNYNKKNLLNNFELLKNVRCSKEIWQVKGITYEQALERAKHDPRVKALHWHNINGSDGRIGGVNGWYQGAGGSIGTVANNQWDTIIINKSESSVFDLGDNRGELWPIIGITYEDAIERARHDPRVKLLHWYKKNDDVLNSDFKGWYEGAGGSIETAVSNVWDTTIINKSESLAFDIGANVGRWTNSNINNYNKILSIEASPYTFEKLKRQCKNSKENLLNYAICDNDGEDIKFYQADSDLFSSINKNQFIDPKSRFYTHSYNEIICKTKTIDNLINQYGKPNLIKIDVEGGEYECIKSLTQKVNCICFEYASEAYDTTYKCINYLLTLGFTKFYIQYSDAYTFIPEYNQYEDVSIVKKKISLMTPKKEWGMIWCI